MIRKSVIPLRDPIYTEGWENGYQELHLDSVSNDVFIQLRTPSQGLGVYYKTEHALIGVLGQGAYHRAPWRNDKVDSFSRLMVKDFKYLDNPFLEKEALK